MSNTYYKDSKGFIVDSQRSAKKELDDYRLDYLDSNDPARYNDDLWLEHQELALEREFDRRDRG